jgi:hypothetical protein
MKLTQTIKPALLVLANISIISLTAVAADENVKADNTAKNQRDRSGEPTHLATSQTVLRI